MYKNEEILNPTPYAPSEQEISLAKARFVFDNYLVEIVDDLIQYYNVKEGITKSSEEEVSKTKSFAQSSIKKWNEAQELWYSAEYSANMWDYFVEHDWFNRVIVQGLKEQHGGDCTAFAVTCGRCLAESYFQIPSSVSWKNNHEGNRLYQEYAKDFKEKNKQ